MEGQSQSHDPWDWVVMRSKLARGLSTPTTRNLWILILASSAFGGFFVDLVTCASTHEGCTPSRLSIDIPCLVFFAVAVLWLLQTDVDMVRRVVLGQVTGPANEKEGGHVGFKTNGGKPTVFLDLNGF